MTEVTIIDSKPQFVIDKIKPGQSVANISVSFPATPAPFPVTFKYKAPGTGKPQEMTLTKEACTNSKGPDFLVDFKGKEDGDINAVVILNFTIETANWTFQEVAFTPVGSGISLGNCFDYNHKQANMTVSNQNMNVEHSWQEQFNLCVKYFDSTSNNTQEYLIDPRLGGRRG